jgi:hypothetical protein
MKLSLKQLRQLIREAVNAGGTKVRPMGGGFQESMAKSALISNYDELAKYIFNVYGGFDIDHGRIAVQSYGKDDRNGWDTHLLTVDGEPCLFIDGPGTNIIKK